jgi:hypothetical protein
MLVPWVCWCAVCRGGGRGLLGPPVGGSGLTRGSAGCRDGHDPGERGADLVGPGPGGRDAWAAGGVGPADQAGGGVQELVAQSFGFGAGQVAVEREDLQPSDQVGGDRRG